MAITEKMGVITQIDENGNEAILYPKTKAELVDGLEEKINEQLGGSGTGGGGADEATVDAKIAEHNTANDSHQDIRLMIKEHEEAVNALLNSDDETLNETKEIVAYIKSNKSLIDAITASKVNVSDIINNLTTNVTNKPLSAAQGVALKALIDGLQSGKLNATDLTSAINTALAQAKASGEFDGKDGKSAYELAQENGYKGSLADFFTDMRGEDGKSAYAYAKDGGYGGTEAEFAEDVNPNNIIAETKSFVVAELAKRGQLKPEFAESLAWLNENGDTTKMYVMGDASSPDFGYVFAYKEGAAVVPPDTNITITGSLKIDSSTGAETTASNYHASNYFEVVDGYEYKVTREAKYGELTAKICYYDSAKRFISTSSDFLTSDSSTTSAPAMTKVVPIIAGAAYWRLRIFYGASVPSGVLSVSAENKSASMAGWLSTGIAFVGNVDDVTESIIQRVIDEIGVPVFGTVDSSKNITLSGTLGNGTYTLRYKNTDGTYSEIVSIVVK